LVARGHCTLPPGPARRKPDSARGRGRLCVPGGWPPHPSRPTRRRTSGFPTASEAHLPTVAHPRAANAFSDAGAVPHPPQPKRAHGFGSGHSAAEKIFLFKKHSKYAFFLQSGGAPHLAGANNSVHPRPPRAGNAVLRYAPLARRRQQTAKQHHAQSPVFGWDVVGATVEQLPPRPDRVRGEDSRYLAQLSTVFLPVRVAYSHPETNPSIY